MRTRVFILLVSFASASLALPVNAQFSLGVNAGITRMKFTGDPPKGFGFFAPRPGFSSAFRLEYRFNDAIALSIQPGFSVLKSDYKVLNDSGTAVVDSTRFTMNSLSLPIHAVVWSENGRFYLLAGFEFQYTLDFKGETLMSPLNISYDVNEYNVFAQFGAGFIIPLGKPYLSFEIRYSQGLVDLNSDIIHQGSYLPRTKLTNMNFLVGLQVPLGKTNYYQVKKKNSR